MTGSAFLANATWLDAPDSDGYARRPIPDAIDQRIAMLLRQYLTLSPAGISVSAPLLDERRAFVLKAFAERMATQAVRKDDEESVILGLAALAFCMDVLDLRELLIVLAPLHDAAERIGRDPATLIARLKAHFPAAVRDLFAPFLARNEDDREIDAMQFVAVIYNGDFTYTSFDKPFPPPDLSPEDEYYGATAAAQEAVNSMLELPATGQEQDWEIELGDLARLDDILEALADNPPDFEIRCALALLATATIDDSVREAIVPRFDQLVRLRELVARDEKLSRRLCFRFIGLRHGLNPSLLAFLIAPVQQPTFDA